MLCLMKQTEILSTCVSVFISISTFALSFVSSFIEKRNVGRSKQQYLKSYNKQVLTVFERLSSVQEQHFLS